MRSFALLLSIVSLLVFAGCTTEDKGNGGGNAMTQASEKASTVMTDITKLLEGVKDGDTAKAASGKLDGLVSSLSPLMDKVKSLMGKASEEAGAAAAGGTEGVGGAIGAAKGLASKASGLLSGGLKDAIASVTKQITRISGNKDMLAPLKGAFDKIKGMMPKMG